MPAAWSEDVRVLAVLVGGGLLIIAIMALAGAVFGRKPGAAAAVEAETSAALPLAGAIVIARRPNLDPEEWISGNVIHLDRQRAVGFIRCDRVKTPVRFIVPARQVGASRIPRVGEKVRFKARHGARRRPVAYVVERAS